MSRAFSGGFLCHFSVPRSVDTERKLLPEQILKQTIDKQTVETSFASVSAFTGAITHVTIVFCYFLSRIHKKPHLHNFSEESKQNKRLGNFYRRHSCPAFYKRGMGGNL